MPFVSSALLWADPLAEGCRLISPRRHLRDIRLNGVTCRRKPPRLLSSADPDWTEGKVAAPGHRQRIRPRNVAGRPLHALESGPARAMSVWGEIPSLVRGLGRDKTARGAGVGACVVPRTSRRLADLLLG